MPSHDHHTGQQGALADVIAPVFKTSDDAVPATPDEPPQFRVGVIIPTWRRPRQLFATLERVLSCKPSPAEVLVHVDANDSESDEMLRSHFAGRVKWVVSDVTRGPGGGRNELLRMAKSRYLVCLDDDSWPLDEDFFERSERIMDHHPHVAVLAAAVTVRGCRIVPEDLAFRETYSFENCGCVMRRDAFLETAGYLSLRYAYGMEEVDLAMQLLERGWKLLFIPGLRVYHDTDMAHHSSAEVNAAQITNAALLGFLRYPLSYWPLAVFQVANRVKYCLSVGRVRGLFSGVLSIPFRCWEHRRNRKPVSSGTIRLYRRLRSH